MTMSSVVLQRFKILLIALSLIPHGWIRIGAKDFINYLSIITEIDFITKAKQFIALYDEKSEMLIVMVNEDYIKK